MKPLETSISILIVAGTMFALGWVDSNLYSPPSTIIDNPVILKFTNITDHTITIDSSTVISVPIQ